MLEERAGLGHGPGGGATWLEVDSLCVISRRQVYVGTYARAREREGGGNTVVRGREKRQDKEVHWRGTGKQFDSY